MSDAIGVGRFGEGPLSRVIARIYTLLVVEWLALLAAAPGLIALLLLDRDVSNVPLAALCALPFGPAVSAALYATHHYQADLTELRPASAFWRGYKMNLAGVLRIWVPWLGLAAILGMNLANFDAAGVPGWWRALLIIIAAAATLWITNALVITSLFAFRTRDLARLSGFFLFARPSVPIGNACLLIVAAGVTYFSSELVLALLASVFALATLRVGSPMIEKVQREFTA